MKALISGADGWLGRTLVEFLLNHGLDVEILIEPGQNQKNYDERLPVPIEVDFRTDFDLGEKLISFDLIFNCAGVQHPTRTKDLYKVNCDGAVRFFRSAINAKVKSFVHVSSINVLGSSPDGLDNLKNESCECVPRTHYAKSKLLGEQLLLENAKDASTKLVILRPGVFYGNSPSANLIQFFKIVNVGLGVLFGKRGFYRSYVNIDVVCEAMMKAGMNSEVEGIFFITDSPPLHTRELYDSIAKAMGKRINIIHLPVFLARLAELLSWHLGNMGIHAALFNKVGEFGRNYVADGNKADKLLGLLKCSPSQGIQSMARSYFKESD